MMLADKSKERMCLISKGECFGEDCMFLETIDDEDCFPICAMESVENIALDFRELTRSLGITSKGELLTYDNSRFAD